MIAPHHLSYQQLPNTEWIWEVLIATKDGAGRNVRAPSTCFSLSDSLWGNSDTDSEAVAWNTKRVTPVAASHNPLDQAKPLEWDKDVVGPVPQRRAPSVGSETPRSTEDCNLYTRTGLTSQLCAFGAFMGSRPPTCRSEHLQLANSWRCKEDLGRWNIALVPEHQLLLCVEIVEQSRSQRDDHHPAPSTINMRNTEPGVLGTGKLLRRPRRSVLWGFLQSPRNTYSKYCACLLRTGKMNSPTNIFHNHTGNIEA